MDPSRLLRLLRRLAGLVLLAFATGSIAQPAAATCGEAAPAARSFTHATARVAPAVVTVLVVKPAADPLKDMEGPVYFQALSGLPLPAPEGLDRSFGSGFILAPDGFVLSSAHIVAGALDIRVVLRDGRRLPAEIVGLDRRSDVALLKIAADGLPAVELAPEPGLCAGDWVAALGTPFGFEATLSVGVVSAWPRELPGGAGVPLIQTDVVLNPGSSGGPLFDAQGRVVGMNSMIYSNTGLYMGVSFAVPAATVWRAARELRVTGRVGRGSLGAALQGVDPALAQAFGLRPVAGALVKSARPLAPGMPGLLSGDILLAMDGRPVRDAREAQDLIDALKPAQAVTLDVWRNRAALRLSLQAEEAPGDAPPPAPARRPPEPRLGLTLTRALPALPQGAYVVSAAGPSLLAGLENGDRITAVNGFPVAGPDDVDATLARLASEPVVALLVWRGASSLYIAVRR